MTLETIFLVEDEPNIRRLTGMHLQLAGYNVKELEDAACARDALRELMCEYAGATGRSVILVFDAYAVPGNPGKAEKYKNIYVIYTREAQTADAFIEQSTYYGRNTARIRVVTSDRPEQLIASGNAALRTSAREFHAEVNRVRDGIAAFLARNNAVRPARTLEAAYKAAWRKEAQKKAGES